MTHKRHRPWYCTGPMHALIDDYRIIADSGGDLSMLRTLKLLRSLIVNVGIIGVTIYSLAATSADATLVSTIGLLTLGLYNGVEVADYAALAQAFAEAKTDQNDTE